MTPKQQAQHLHDSGFDYHDACTIARYNPHEEMRQQVVQFLKLLVAVTFIAVLALFALDVEPAEQKQLGGTGICENTRMKT